MAKQKNNNLPLILILLFSGFLALLTETILNNALTTIMKELSVSESTVQWLSTGYILIVGIMMPIAVYLINKFPLRKLLPTALLIFTLGTLIDSLATNFNILLLGRLIQGIAVGIIMPLVTNIMLLLFPPEKRGMAMGLASIVIVFGPAVGPTLSGWIIDNFEWHMLFTSVLPFSIIALLFSLIVTKNVNKLQDSTLDWLSVFLSTVGLGTLLYGFSRIGEVAKLDVIAGICLLIGIIFIYLFVKRQLKIPVPLLSMEVFKAKSFSITTILSAFASIAQLGGELLIPLYLQSVRGTSALTSGLLLLPGALAMMVASPLAGTLYDRYGIKNLAIVGFSILTLATLPMVWFTQTTPLWLITVLYALRMIGCGLVVMQLGTSGVNALPQRLAIHGNTVSSTTRQIATSLGTSLLVTIAAIISNGNSSTGTSNLLVGYQGAFLVATIIALLCLVMSFTLTNKTTQEID